MDGPLAGIRVVDFSWHVAGPFCTRMLADYGAEVVKIERPGSGDPARLMGPFRDGDRDSERSGLFLSLNTNKRGITLDLASSAGREIAWQLIDEADLLVESFSPGTMERLGLDYQRVRARRPDLVYCSISNFGQTGPYRDHAMTDFTLYAMGGAMHATGVPDREPIKLGARTQLVHGGYVAAAATLMTYYGAKRQGVGDHIDVSLFETAMGSVDRRQAHLVAHAYTGLLQGRDPDWGGGYPTGVYPCADGYFFLSGGGRFFPRAAAMLGRRELASDDYFSTPEGQLDPARREEFEATVFLPWVLARTRQQALEAGQAAGVLCGIVNTMADLLDAPQFVARDYWNWVDHPVAGPLPYPGAPFQMPESPWTIRRPAPLLGEHTDEVLVQLGLDSTEVADLRARAVVA